MDKNLKCWRDFPISTQMSNSPVLLCLAGAHRSFYFLGCQDGAGARQGGKSITQTVSRPASGPWHVTPPPRPRFLPGKTGLDSWFPTWLRIRIPEGNLKVQIDQYIFKLIIWVFTRKYSCTIIVICFMTHFSPTRLYSHFSCTTNPFIHFNSFHQMKFLYILWDSHHEVSKLFQPKTPRIELVWEKSGKSQFILCFPFNFSRQNVLSSLKNVFTSKWG